MQKTCIEENAHVNKTCGGADGADAAAAKAMRSALPPKFKDVSALAEAYNALQAEFTRRCQRLKELEMRAEEYSGKASQQADNKSFSDVVGGVHAADGKDSSGKQTENGIGAGEEANTENREAAADAAAGTADPEAEKSDVSKMKNAGSAAAGDDAGNGESEANFAVSARKSTDEALPAERPEKKDADEGFDEETRLKIIGEYLDSLRKNAAPLVRGGAGTFGTPPAKATSLEEAGAMALRAFRRG